MYNNIKKENIYLDARTSGNALLHLAMAGISLPNPLYLICHSESTDTLWPYYNFEYVISGKGYIKTKHKTYVVQAGDLFFLNKNRNHTYYSDKNEPYEKMFISINGSYVDSLIQLHNITNSVVISKTNVRPVFEKIFSISEQYLGHNFPPEIYTEISCAILTLIQAVSPLDFTLNTEKLTLHPAEVLKNYIDDNIYEKLQLKDLCAFMNLSEMHLQRIFKEAYGITIVRYIREQKLIVAKHLLSTTFLKISEISDKLSYDNPKCFATLFKKHFGISPSDYAKKFKVEMNTKK